MNTLFSLALLASFPISLMASTVPTGMSAQKYCVYDADIVMSKSQEWKEAVTKLDEDSQKNLAELKKQEEELMADAGKVQAKQGVVSMESLENEQKSLLRRRRDLEVKVGQLQEDYKMEYQNIARKFGMKLHDQVQNWSSKNQYDLVLPKGMGVYASNQADRTDSLVEFMNKNYEQEKKDAKTQVSSLKTAAADKKTTAPVKVASAK